MSAHSITDPDAHDPERAMVSRVQHGDIDAFAGLVDRYKQPITHFAARMLGDRVEAQDVAQNVFLRAFRECGRFRFESKVSTWLYRIARNLCLNELRRRNRQRLDWLGDGGLPAIACEGIGELTNDLASDSLMLRELEDKLGLALAALPEKQRTALLLIQEQKLSYQEIAAVLGHSVPAVKSLIHRGRQKLRACFKIERGPAARDFRRGQGSPLSGQLLP